MQKANNNVRPFLDVSAAARRAILKGCAHDSTRRATGQRADGDPLRATFAGRVAASLMRATDSRGLKDVPKGLFHDSRHSHATALLLAGVHPKVDEERLGHSTSAQHWTSTAM